MSAEGVRPLTDLQRACLAALEETHWRAIPVGLLVRRLPEDLRKDPKAPYRARQARSLSAPLNGLLKRGLVREHWEHFGRHTFDISEDGRKFLSENP